MIECADFSINKAIYYDGYIYYLGEFVVSLLTKKVSYTGSDLPKVSLLRVKKYLDKGYTISSNEIIKIEQDIERESKNELPIKIALFKEQD